MIQLFFNNAVEWRTWLGKHHDKYDEVWLVFSKKGVVPSSLTYTEALEEALCFGWVDSLIKRLDDKQYMRKFTPRNPDSHWSKSNIQHVEELIGEGRMAKPGMDKVNHARNTGSWFRPVLPPEVPTGIPEAFQVALQNDPEARAVYERLSPSHQKEYHTWIVMAKRQETRDRRIKEALKLLKQGRKLGLK